MERLLKKNVILSIINNSFYDSLLPLNLNYWYNFGSLLGLSLIIQIISGIFLAMHYVPNISLAFDSVEYIMREVPTGWLIRYIHSNGASIFFIMVYLHIMRGLYYGSYTGRRNIVWIIGVIIFFIMILTAFLGYVLVWGSMSLWGAVVITNLLSTIPLVGDSLVQWIWGGFSVGNATLNRFYSLHYLLPFIIAALSLLHLLTLHEVGGSNPLGINSNIVKINFHPYYTTKDLLGFIISILLLLFFVFYFPNFLGHSDNYIEADPLVTPTHIVPEWYLLPFYAILRAIPNKTLGVIAMITSILILTTIYIFHTSLYSSSLFRPFYKLFLGIFIFNFLLLLWIGQSVVEQPFILIGQLLTFYYFTFFLFIIPFISFFELFFLHLHKSNF